MGRLHRLLKLSWAEKVLLIQVAILLGTTRLCLQVLPFRTVQRLFAWSSKKPVNVSIDARTYQRQLVWAVKAVGRRMLGDKPCLPQALVVRWLLKRRGYPVALHIGVIKDGEDQMQAHAWVEHEGEIIIGGRLSPRLYTRLQPMEEGYL